MVTINALKEFLQDHLWEIASRVEDKVDVEIVDKNVDIQDRTGVFSYTITVEAKLREAGRIYYDGIVESFNDGLMQSGEELSEEEYEKMLNEYVGEEIRKFDEEHGVKPFEFKYKDTMFEIANSTYVEDDNYKRTWFDTMVVKYRNQVSIDFVETWFKKFTSEKEEDVANVLEDMEKAVEYESDLIATAIREFKEILMNLLKR